MDPFTSTALRAAAAGLATAAATGTLAHFARRWGEGRWPSISALLLGPVDPENGDLRFAAVVASVASGVSWVIALDAPLRTLSPTARAAGIALGFPIVALAVSAVADLVAGRDEAGAGESTDAGEDDTGTLAVAPAPAATASPATSSEMATMGKALTGMLPPGTQDALRVAIQAGSVVAGAAATVASDPRVQAAASAAAGAALRGGTTVVKGAVSAVADVVAAQVRTGPSSAERERVRRLIEEALDEVGAARARTEDGSIREALSSMEEALTGYREIVDDADADLDRIAIRCGEVMALAQSCEDDGVDAFRTLGLKRDATIEQAKRVYRELAKIYHSDVGSPGVDEDKFKEITVAYERVRAALEPAQAA